MRYALTVLAVLTLMGCSGSETERPPVTPTAPAAPANPSPPTTPAPPDPVSRVDSVPPFWGMVIDASGVCITGATVRLTTADEADPGIVQDANCDAWAYGGGFALYNLPLEVELTLLVSAPGYVSREVTIVHTRSRSLPVHIRLAAVGGTGSTPVSPPTLDRGSTD